MNLYKPSFMFAVVLLTGVVSAWVGVTQADFGDGRVLSFERRAYFRQGGYLRISTFFFGGPDSTMRQ